MCFEHESWTRAPSLRSYHLYCSHRLPVAGPTPPPTLCSSAGLRTMALRSQHRMNCIYPQNVFPTTGTCVRCLAHFIATFRKGCAWIHQTALQKVNTHIGCVKIWCISMRLYTPTSLASSYKLLSIFWTGPHLTRTFCCCDSISQEQKSKEQQNICCSFVWHLFVLGEGGVQDNSLWPRPGERVVLGWTWMISPVEISSQFRTGQEPSTSLRQRNFLQGETESSRAKSRSCFMPKQAREKW